MKCFRLHIFSFIILFGVIGCNDYDIPQTEALTPPSTNISIGELSRLVASDGKQISEELIIGGYVTSSDDAGNFYRTFTIEDTSGGAEIMAGIYELHNLYPMGHYVIVKLEGAFAARHNGVLQIGLAPNSYSSYPTDYFSSRPALDKHIFCYDVVKQLSPSQQSISSLGEQMCGLLITVEGVELCSAFHAEGWQVNSEGTWSGYNFFRDAAGNEITVHTSEYADYAEQKVPTAQVALTGVLHRGVADGKEYYMIKMRDESDCQILH